MDCTSVNETFQKALQHLYDSICEVFLNELRKINQNVCRICNDIAQKLSEMPENTREVINLYNYLLESRDSTMIDVKQRLVRCADLIIFLFNERANFTSDDLKLISKSLTWPREMDKIMDLANTTLGGRKEFVEGVLRNRKLSFEDRKMSMFEKVEFIKNKDPPVLTLEEIERTSSEIISISKGMILRSKIFKFYFYLNKNNFFLSNNFNSIQYL